MGMQPTSLVPTGLPIPTLGTPQYIVQTPAQAANAMKNFLSTSVTGNSILSAAAYPKRNFPNTDQLGLGSMLDSAAIFPFKNNSIGLTDIDVPTTILVLGGEKQNQILYQTNKFILQSIVKPIQERFQIIETFGEPSIQFFDRRTRIFTVQGILFDAEDPTQLNNPGGTTISDALKSVNYWATAFQDFFETTLRGTKLVQADPPRIAALYINNWFIKGYPLQLTITKSSETLPYTAAFQMTWAVRDETLLSSKSAESLWKKNRLSKATMDALNAYVGSLNTYTDAYNTYVTAAGNPAISPDDMNTLITKRDKAAADTIKAMEFVRIAMARDASASNTGR